MPGIVGRSFFAGSLYGWYGLVSTLLILFLLLLCIGIAGPNASAIALAPFSRNAGSASALWGGLQIGLGALASAGVGLLNFSGSLPTAIVMAASAVIGLAILLAGEKRITEMVRSDDTIGELI